jgi:hypothetical protein
MMKATNAFLSICFLISLSTSIATAQTVQPQSITKQQADVLLSVLQGKRGYEAKLGKFPPLPPGARQPIPVATGVPGLLPNESESRHWIQYMVGTGTNSRRTVFEFTVTPPVSPHYEGIALVNLLDRRKVTQYLMWHASSSPQNERPQDAGIVVDFLTRSAPIYCVPL